MMRTVFLSPWAMEFGMKGRTNRTGTEAERVISSYVQESVIIEIFFWYQLKFLQTLRLESLQML